MKATFYAVWSFIRDYPISLFIALAVVLVTILALVIVEIITTDRSAGSGKTRR